MISEKRKYYNYTQLQMANKLDISLRQYARIDKEEDLPRRDILRKLIYFLNLSDEEVGKYIKNMVNNKAT